MKSETIICAYCGHGPETSIGVEVQTNPFMLD